MEAKAPQYSAHLARQAIFNASGETVGYELLYRADPGDRVARIDDPDQACRSTIVSAVCEIGLDTLVGSRRAFMNLSEGVLRSGDIAALAPERVVAEVLEDVPVCRTTRGALEELRSQGFRVALDDFAEGSAAEGLLPLADIVKLDVLGKTTDEVASQVERLRARSSAQLLAEKVETASEFEAYRDLGFDLFQGFFLCRPELVARERLPRYRTASLDLLASLQDSSIPLAALQGRLERNAALSYKLLRLLNSSMMGLRRRVDSVGQALVLIGEKRLRKWATLIALAGFDDSPQELLVLALVRARMCELLAQGPNSDSYFTVGLFSALEAMSRLPMQEIVAELPLSQEVEDALVDRSGRLGDAVASVLAYERGEFERAARSGLSMESLSESYLGAIHWADETAASL